MLTTEERMTAIKIRTKEIKRQNRKKNGIIAEISGVAASLCIICILGIRFPLLLEKCSSVTVASSGGTASMIGNGATAGIIVMGILCFLLGISVTVLLFKIRENRNKNPEEGSDEF